MALPPASLTKDAKPRDVKGLPVGVVVRFGRPKTVPVKFVKKDTTPASVP
jgi:hypothetical protein